MRHLLWGSIINTMKVGNTSRQRIETRVAVRFKHEMDCTKDDPFRKHCKKVETPVEELPNEKLVRDTDCNVVLKKCSDDAKPDCFGPSSVTPPTKEEIASRDSSARKEDKLVLARSSELGPVDTCPVTDESDPRVVIIGAGIAGMTAASRLTSVGLSNVIVLEATGRTGGRIQSAYWRGTFIDLGGVINEEETDDPFEPENNNYLGNPLIFHADRLGMIRFKKNLWMARSMITENDGSTLPLAPTFLALTKMQRILEVAESMRIACPYTDQGRTAEYMGMRMQQEIRAMGSELRAVSARVFIALALLAADKKFICDNGSGPTMTIPGSGIALPVGTAAPVTTLACSIASLIKYYKNVNSISWGVSMNGPRAIVRTMDGCEYPADYVIFTPSMGYLQNNHERIFCPPLPYLKVKALVETPFSHITKVFIHYPLPIPTWRNHRIAIKLNESAAERLPCPICGLRELKEVEGSENIISAVLRGPCAPIAETAPDNELMDALHMFIKQTLGDECLPPPNDIVRSCWTSNEFYRGSKSHFADKVMGLPLPACGCPTPPVIFFAGDGTSTVKPGTVIGAFSSGLSAADKILSYLPGKRDTINAIDSALQMKAAAVA